MRCLVVVPFMLLSGQALAQEGLPAQVYACAGMEEASQRHACFDALVPELKRAQGATAVTGAAPKSALTAPVLSASEVQAAKAEKEASPDRATFTVTAITRASDGKYRLTMDNGQIWRQVDTTRLRNLGEGPWTAEIRKAALGSFLLTVGDSAAVRVERVN